jgi:uncharacterized membrane protein YgcG
MRIEVGYGLEGIIPDASAFAIVSKILTPAFKSGDFAGGLTQAVSVMSQAIAGDPSAMPTANQSQGTISGNAFFSLFFAAIFIFRVLFVAMARTKSWWLGGVLGAIRGGRVQFLRSLCRHSMRNCEPSPLVTVFRKLMSATLYKYLSARLFPWSNFQSGANAEFFTDAQDCEAHNVTDFF